MTTIHDTSSIVIQSCFNQIIIHNGDNNYNIEHISKYVVEEADEIFNFNNTDDDTNDTNYKSDDINNS